MKDLPKSIFSSLCVLFVGSMFLSVLSLSDENPNACCRRSFYTKQPNGVCHVENDVHKTESIGKTKKALRKAEEVMSLPRIDPIKVGFTRQIVFNGKNHTLKTLSLRPPVFEIPDFLSSDECDLIINMATAAGLTTSQTVWQEFDDVLHEGNLYPIFKRLDVNDDEELDYFELVEGIQGIQDVYMEIEDVEEMFDYFQLDYFDDRKISFNEFKLMTTPEIFDQMKSFLTTLESRKTQAKTRKSFSAFLDPSINPEQVEFFEDLYNRISKVTNLPIEMIRYSEALQVIKYEVNGHYHAHHDSENTEYAPCCHLIRSDSDICRPCRYATMFYYLNEPIEGGSTAFPFADNETFNEVEISRDEKHRLNLSGFCDKANLVYKPKKGAALFWYNHVIDEETGWVGKLDDMSYHGGCDVIKGVKWAANNWLNANSDREKDWEVWRNFEDSPIEGEYTFR